MQLKIVLNRILICTSVLKISANVPSISAVACTQTKITNEKKNIYTMKNTEKNGFNATIGNTMCLLHNSNIQKFA